MCGKGPTLRSVRCWNEEHRRGACGTFSFLIAVKQRIEDPDKMVFGNKEPEGVLLGL